MKAFAKVAVLSSVLLLPAVSRATATYYIETSQTGAQTQIDVNHTSTFDFTPTFAWPSGGGIFTMKSGSGSVDNVILTLYDLTDSITVDSVVLTPGSFTSSFNPIDFFFAAPDVLTPFVNYRLQLTSSAADAQSTAYFIKDDGVNGFFDSQGSPLPTSGVAPEPSSLTLLLAGAGLLLAFKVLRRRSTVTAG